MGSQTLSPAGPAAADRPGVLVWDIWVRLFHWSLVGCVVANFALLEEGEAPHRWVGYFATALILARVVWGFIGSPHARFSSFFPTPRRLRAHVAELRSGRHEPHLGHNPLGAVMMLLLMALVLGLGLTGYLQGLDAFWGEEWLKELHEALANGLILLAGVHALAALVMGRLEHTHLVVAMVTGRKRVREAARPQQ